MEMAERERVDQEEAQVRVLGFVRAYDRVDWFLALFVFLATWTLLTVFACSVLHPEFWPGVAIASGVRPPDSAASGLGLGLTRLAISLFGVEHGVSVLVRLGHALGALAAGLVYLLMRGTFSARLSLKPKELADLSPRLRLLAVVGTMAFACSEALWHRMQFLSDELICVLLGVVALVAFDRFRRHRRLGWLGLFSFAAGFLAAETPIGLLLAAGAFVWDRHERKLYWERRGALKVLLRDPNDPNSHCSRNEADAVVSVNKVKADDPEAFLDDELEDEIKKMVFLQESWLAVFVFLTGFVAAVAVGGRVFGDLGGLAVEGGNVWDYPMMLITSWYRQLRPVLLPANLFFSAVFSFFPFCIAYILMPVATDDKGKFKSVTSFLIVLMGVVSWLQLSPIAGCWYWTWNLAGIDEPPATLRAFMAFFGASSLMASLQVVCCICRRPVQGARKIMVEEGVALGRIRLLCRILLAAVAGAVVILSVVGSRQPDVRRKLEFVGEYVKTFAAQARGLGWVFTDGAFDDAFALELRASGETKPVPLSMMSGRNAYAAHLRARAAEDDEDRRVLRAGTLETLRYWASERPERLARVALQLGLEVLVKCRVTGARSAGLMLRVATPDDNPAFDRHDDAVRELSEKALAIAVATAFGGFDRAVSDKFDFILWRLARIAELRMKQALVGENGPSAARERALVKRLDEANEPYLKLKAKLESQGNYEGLVLSPQEGLAVALKRGDFNLARSYANRALRLDPSDPNANFAVGMWAIENQLYGVAAKYLEAAREKRPDEPAILNNLAMVHLKLGDLDKALALIEHAAKASPGSTEILQNRKRIREAIASRSR